MSSGIPFHKGMACPQVADGGNGLQIWRVAANILNKRLRTSDKGRFCGLRFGWRSHLFTVNKVTFYEILRTESDSKRHNKKIDIRAPGLSTDCERLDGFLQQRALVDTVMNVLGPIKVKLSPCLTN
jgi:hypothetical protein